MTVHVFTGPTLSPSEVREISPDFRIHPPLKRGDLGNIDQFSDPQAIIAVIDGVFGATFAAPASEFVDALARGIRIIGSSSLGAVRAMECRNHGMLGWGRIYKSFLEGKYVSDAEVAVGVDADRDFQAVTVPLADIREACSTGVGRRLITETQAEAVVEVSSSIHYLERTPSYLRYRLTSGSVLSGGQYDRLLRLAEAKKSDAIDCLEAVRDNLVKWPSSPAGLQREPRIWTRGFPSQIEGALLAEGTQASFVRWLFGSGRIYQIDTLASRLPQSSIASTDIERALSILDEYGLIDSELLIWHSHMSCADALESDKWSIETWESALSLASLEVKNRYVRVGLHFDRADPLVSDAIELRAKSLIESKGADHPDLIPAPRRSLGDREDATEDLGCTSNTGCHALGE